MVISKADAMDFAENIRKLVDALIDEGFGEDVATAIVMEVLTTNR